MPESPLSLKATVTKRQAAEPVPPDMAERLEQLRHHQAVTADTEPAQAQDPDPDKVHQPEQDAATAMPEPAPVPKAKHNPHALQAVFLTGNLGRPVTVFTINGLRLTGKLRQFDQFTLLLEGRDGIHSLVLKHAITTVTAASAAPGKQRQPE